MKKDNDNLGYDADMFEKREPEAKPSTNMFVPHPSAAYGGAAQPVNNGLSFTAQDNTESLNQYATKTFLWMFYGLMTTFVLSIGFFATGAWMILFEMPALPFILAIAELILVFALAGRVTKMQVSTGRILFFAYAALNGLTFSSLFALYGVQQSIYVFGLTALYFGALALYGWKTKRDLTSLRPILFCGLIFLLAFWVLSMFLNMSGMETIISIVGIIIFMGYTAYDTQKIKAMYSAFGGNTEMANKTSILCALELYLDFINLFLYLLRFVGRRN